MSDTSQAPELTSAERAMVDRFGIFEEENEAES